MMVSVSIAENWSPTGAPSKISSVLFSSPTSPITITIHSPVTVVNLTLADGVTLHFTNNATLTVLNCFTMHGGTLESHSSSFLSNTSTTFLVLDGFDFSLSSHTLIVTFSISWLHGFFSMDNSSELILRNSQYMIDSTPEFSGSNTIYVWGMNTGGKLGPSTDTLITYPDPVVLPSFVRQVSQGYSHSMVLLANGDVYTTGSNNYGQLGQVSDNAQEFNRVDIPKAFQVNAGEHSSFALMDDGTFYCWGQNNDHQMGLVPRSTKNQREPFHNDFIDDVIQLAGSRNSMFALRSTCAVYSWGHNPDGCLCLGHGTSVDRPEYIEGIPPVEFVASGIASYLIFKNGSTSICGRPPATSIIYTTPRLFDSSKRFVMIHTVGTSAIGIDLNQKLWTWGENSNGKLGNGTGTNSPYPLQVKPDTTFTSASSALQHKAALGSDGTIFTWGLGAHGRLARSGTIEEMETPMPIPDFTKNPHFVLNCNRDSAIAYEKMSLGVSPGFKGNGSLVLDSSELRISSMTASLSHVLLRNSILTLVNASFENVKDFDLSSSTMQFLEYSTISSNDFVLDLESSELYLEEEVVITSSSISLIAINSRLNYWTEFFLLSIIDLKYSFVYSSLINVVTFDSFACFHCELLTNQKINISNHLEINSANISASIELLESVSDAILSGNIRISSNFNFYSPPKLIDLQLSTLQSELSIKPYLRCFSNVLFQNSVSILNVDVDFHHNVLLLNASLLLDQDLVINHKLSGSGLIESNVLNYGLMVPDKSLEFSKKLSLLSSSNLKYLLSSSLDHQISIIGDVYLSGMLLIEVVLTHDIIGRDLELISAGELIGNFSEIHCDCDSILSIFYTSSSVFASVNDYIVNLNQVSYISTTGFDDPCCGTFDSPCASFKGVLERMGRKGKVYFHGGSYSFNQGLGNVIDVDWEVIGLGDVNIEGMGETLFEIDESVFVLSNVFVNTSTTRTFHISNSTVSVNNSTFHSLYMFSDGVVFDSSFTVCSSSFTSFSFEIGSSEVEFSNSTFAGEVSDFLFQYQHHR
ncbi:hypothetical protein GEMRC1_008235 [Eukaryota sp. GEM-RC1]